MQDIIKVIILSIVSEIVLFILTKLMGNKEMSQLSMFDYIIGITIGSIAAEMATALESDYRQPLVAMIVYAILAIIISLACTKSIKARRFIYGNSLILMDNGKFYRKNFKTAKLDLNEFLVQCRINGYFHLSDIKTAILEANGKISFLPKSSSRPVVPSDLKLTPEPSTIDVNLIMDGKILFENLKNSNHDEMWLQKELVSQGFDKPEQIFLATLDNQNRVSLYENNDLGNSHDFWA